MNEAKLGIVLAYSKAFVGLPYVWGGSHPSQGYDCSGLVQELLASVGLDPVGDQTAQSLYSTLRHWCKDLQVPEKGAILFFGESENKITHTAFAIDDAHMIEAGGGGRATKGVKEAIASQAFVRVRPIFSRKDLVASLLPQY